MRSRWSKEDVLERRPERPKVWTIRSLGNIEVGSGQEVDVPEHNIPDTKRARLQNIVGTRCSSRRGRAVFPSPTTRYGKKEPYVACKNVRCDKQWD